MTAVSRSFSVMGGGKEELGFSPAVGDVGEEGDESLREWEYWDEEESAAVLSWAAAWVT
jgi:hypothetical protein